MSEGQQTVDVEVTDRKRVPVIWLLPIIAALIGLWVLYYDISNRGPEITIEFRTAEGITAGKTKIKARNVDLGVVDSVTLKEDLQGVVVTAELDPAARPFINAGAKFWVVRARVDAGGVSGLGTLLSGGYIELAPGTSSERLRDFVGLERPPVTAVGTPGLRLNLNARRAGSVSSGDPVLYRGFTVGRIESADFDLKKAAMSYQLFIDAPYDSLVKTTTRFWNRSGIEFSASAAGLTVETGSLQSILTGGVEFDTSDEFGVGQAVKADANFTLFENKDEAHKDPYDASELYVVMFQESLRGLNPGAPVEVRGIKIGRVERIMLDELSDVGLLGSGLAIPVLIRLEPGRFRWPDNETGLQQMRGVIPQAVATRHMFATLQTSNLLTGQLMVTLEFFVDEEPGKLGTFAGLPTIPTKSTGFAQIEQKVVAILDNVRDMPLTEIGDSTEKALDELSATLNVTRETLASVENVLANENTQRIPAELASTLAQLRTTLDSFAPGSSLYEKLDGTVLELQRTLKAVEDLVESVENQPNSLIFPVKRGPDPEPGEYQ